MLNKICTDLTNSKKLKELGIEMETKFYWEEDFFNADISVGCWLKQPQDSEDYFEYTACFTLEQILEMLPKEHLERNLTLDLFYGQIYYERIGRRGLFITTQQDDENLATTACRLLIELKEKGII